MKKEIRELKNNVVQITTLNERWYARQIKDKKSGIPTYEFLPSSNWIADYYPKGLPFYKWLADKGWDRAEEIRTERADVGSKVHQATCDLELGEEIPIDAKYTNPNTGEQEELTVEEIDAIQSFCNWHNSVKPELLAMESTVFGKYWAGTLDRIYRISGIWIVDFKTGQNIWPSSELALSSYSHTDIDYKSMGIKDDEWANRKLAILQLGYRKNKNHYKLTPIDDKFDLFETAYSIWKNENPDAKPRQAEYPLVLTLSKPKKSVKSKEQYAFK